jgi:hypothetical protein
MMMRRREGFSSTGKRATLVSVGYGEWVSSVACADAWSPPSGGSFVLETARRLRAKFAVRGARDTDLK